MNAAQPASPATNPPPNSGATGMEFVFDPLRLIGALLERYRWIIFAAAIGFALLLTIGIIRSRDRYESSARLIKREPPNTFRAGEIGDPYKPRTLNSATLVASALSDNVLARVSAQANPPISLKLLRLTTTATEIRGTDFLQLSLKNTESAQAAADLVNLWAREIVEFSRDMQSRESREVRTYLQQQVEATDTDLNAINQSILEFSRRENLIDADKQTDVFLNQLADLDMRYETARIDCQTVEFKLKALESELAHYSAANDRLVSARSELRDALGRYTNQNPLVQNLQAKVDALETETAAKPKEVSLADYATTAVGGNLYLELIDLRARHDGAQKQLAGLTALREQARTRVEQLPEKIAALARLRLGQRGLETARQLLSARLREATVFSERAPGYYQVFSASTAQTVGTTSKLLKIPLYGLIGLVLGAGVGLVLVAGRELLDQRLRSPSEARRIFQVPLLAVLEPGADPSLIIGSLWVSWATAASVRRQPAVLWAAQPDGDEQRIWTALLAEAARLQPELNTLDAGPRPIDALKNARRLDPASLTLTAALAAAETHAVPPLWVRMAGDTVEPALSLARAWCGAVLLVPLDRASVADWQRQARILREAGVTLHGIIVTNARPWWKRHAR